MKNLIRAAIPDNVDLLSFSSGGMVLTHRLKYLEKLLWPGNSKTLQRKQ